MERIETKYYIELESEDINSYYRLMVTDGNNFITASTTLYGIYAICFMLGINYIDVTLI